MALQLYLGGSGSGKSHKLYEHIIQESIKHPEINYLILVPEQYTLTTQYKLVNMHPRKGILNIDILSFKRLSDRVFEEVGYSAAKGVTIDDIGKNLILRHMAGENEDKLTALSGVFNKIGYISEVKSVISEFMQYGIGNEELDRMLDNCKDRGILRSKLEDIKLLYNEFTKYINDRYVTTEEILERVKDVVPKSEKLKRSVIILDGYTGFTPVQYNLLTVLLSTCIDVYVTVLADTNDLDTSSGEQELFAMSKQTIAKLERICKLNDIEKKQDVLIENRTPARFLYDCEGELIDEKERRKDLIHLENNLFRSTEKKFIYENEGDNRSIHVISGTTPEDEAVEVAVRIERLIREEKYRYREIAVVSGDIGTYMDACTRVFARYDIPFFVDKTRPVLLNPMIEYIRSVMRVLAENYSYEAIFGYLRSGMTDIKSEDIDRLENYILCYGIKGYRQWNEKFIKKPEEMEVDELIKLNEIRERIIDDFAEFRAAVSGEDGRLINKSVREISTELYKFLVSHNLYTKMEHFRLKFEESGDAVRAKEYAQIYEEVCVLLDKMVELLPQEVISIKEYSQLLDAGFAEIRTGVIPKSNDYVQIGDVTRTRLRDIKALFFMGVNDGIIPMSGGNGGIISEMDREFLKECDSEIEMAPSAREQAYTQRLYLYMLVTKPSEQLYISYAKLAEDGKSINSSYFVKTIMRMFPEISVEHSDDSIRNRVYGPKNGYYELTRKMEDYLAGGEYADADDYEQLYKLYANDGQHREQLRRLLDFVFSEGIFTKTDKISRAVADVLYGRELTCSVTRLENYAKCAYSHFLKYGLSLKERELFSFEAKDMGSIFHDALQSYAGILKERNLSWFDISEEDSLGVIDEAIERCIGKDDYGALYGSFRTKYTINRMRRITRRTVETLTEQLRKGSFIPNEFEFKFSSTSDYKSLNIELSEDEKIHLMGRIDRIDTCEDERNIYVKVIDYKSGNKKFDLAAIYMGLDLQLVVYMNAAMETMAVRGHKQADNRNIVPAGILYYHIDDPLINVDGVKMGSVDDINENIKKQLKMNGLVNADEKVYRLMDNDFEGKSSVIPIGLKKDGDFARGSSVASSEEFKIISDYVNYKIGTMGKEIFDGNIAIEPHKKSEKDALACQYCSYSNICGYRGRGSVEDIDESNFSEDEAEDSDDNSGQISEIVAKMKQQMESDNGLY